MKDKFVEQVKDAAHIQVIAMGKENGVLVRHVYNRNTGVNFIISKNRVRFSKSGAYAKWSTLLKTQR